MFRPLLFFTVLALLPALCAHASSLAGYSHTAWNGRHGAPSDVMQFTQTPDGWLWVSSPNGLFRFDGVDFERMTSVQGHALHTESTLGLLTTRDGKLWVGGRFGGISVFGDGRVRRFAQAEGLPRSSVLTMTEGPDGTVWVCTGAGLSYLSPGANRFRQVGKNEGLQEKRAHQVLFDRNGRQWVAAVGGIYFRDPGATQFRRAWPYIELMAMAEAPDGTLWASDGVNKHYRVRAEAPEGNPRPQAEFGGTGALFDREGNIWILRRNVLERRVAPYVGNSAKPAQLTRQNGMSGSLAQTVFEDKEGNIWIGTSGGIDRLRRNRLHSVALDTPFDRPSVVADHNAGVIIGDWHHPLRRYTAAGPHESLGRMKITTAYRANNGDIWFASPSERWRRSAAGTLTRLPHPDQWSGHVALAMTIDGRGRMWLSLSRLGLFEINGTEWTRNLRVPDTAALALITDERGRAWASFPNNRIAMIDGEQVQVFGEADGLQLGNVQSLLADGERVWAGGQRGWAWYDGRRWHRPNMLDGRPIRGVSGIVRLANGELWLYGSDGISRIPADAVQRMLAQPESPLPYERFDALDGLVGSAEQIAPLPSMAQSTDGRLWFATASEVASLDPASIARNPRPPPVQVLSLRAGDVTYAAQPSVDLPLGQRDLRIAYTALGLAMPERVRFRYKLEGFDEHWRDAGTRREAVYTNLAPGDYRFRVIAANEDGVWNEVGASVELSLPPRFVETGWFRLLVLVLIAALLAGAYRLRVRQLSARLQYRMQERLAERERIARGLHDTLLQSVQGLILSFHHQTRSLPVGPEEREKIERTLDLADDLLAEGRDCITGLRGARAPEDLGLALASYGEALLQHRFTATINGQPQALMPGLCEEVQMIVREALFNASRHARAHRVELIIDYRRDRLNLTVRDDGCGMSPTVAREGRSGHYGIVGMNERAQAIGARYTLVSTPGQGTTVTLDVPAERAYQPLPSPTLLERLRQRRRPSVEAA
ncbi:histidine kinase [Pseudoduganella sp. DS3]|uniref:Histidine kinase n=1 Tax=Pseudoduganella guangdongensis TaxID=2692179 RepID=A0A6N9HQ38_9BURK|nr:sensor histidine kinase [Pseudoduganella guangdongensis]MYN05363.1 histidine kinase [Pseudoduganella guangdongensis]